MHEELNPFKIAQYQLDLAAKKLGLDAGIHQRLRWPERVLIVSIPVRMDDGSIRVFEGYRVAVQRLLRADQGRHPLPSQRHAR